MTKVTLADVCEPLFQYVCRLNRSARKGVLLDGSMVRADVLGVLKDMQTRASQQPGLSGEYDKIELPLIYFMDFMIKESELSFSRDWEPLAYDRNRMAGDEEFFDLLEETLRDPSEQATNRLEIFYTCLGLGFTGMYTGQTDWLRRKMQEVGARLRDRMVTDDQAKLCPETYEHVDTSDLVQPPGRSLMIIVVLLIASGVVVVVGNGLLYRMAANELDRSIDGIIRVGERIEQAPDEAS